MRFSELLFEPEVVMLLRPIEIHFAGAHGLESTFHPKRSDVDVRENDRYEQHRNHGMDRT